MGDLERNLLADEKIIFRTKKHWIIFVLPGLFALFVIFATIYMSENPILVKVSWVPATLAAFLLGYVFLEYRFSAFAVTDKRVIMREGFFNKHMNELRLSTIAQVNINQGIVGQLMDFGTISINSFGVSDTYTLIDKATAFQRVVNQELDKLVR